MLCVYTKSRASDVAEVDWLVSHIAFTDEENDPRFPTDAAWRCSVIKAGRKSKKGGDARTAYLESFAAKLYAGDFPVLTHMYLHTDRFFADARRMLVDALMMPCCRDIIEVLHISKIAFTDKISLQLREFFSRTMAMREVRLASSAFASGAVLANAIDAMVCSTSISSLRVECSLVGQYVDDILEALTSLIILNGSIVALRIVDKDGRKPSARQALELANALQLNTMLVSPCVFC